VFGCREAVTSINGPDEFFKPTERSVAWGTQEATCRTGFVIVIAGEPESAELMSAAELTQAGIDRADVLRRAPPAT